MRELLKQIRLSDVVFILPLIMLWLWMLYVYHGGGSGYRGEEVLQVWQPELDQYMSTKGFVLEQVVDETGSPDFLEVRKNGIAVWRIYEGKTESRTKVIYLGPDSNEEASRSDYQAAIDASLAEHAEEFVTQTGHESTSGD